MSLVKSTVIGSPVTFVSVFSSEHCLYAQGPWLCAVSLLDNRQQSQLLVLEADRSQTIHGVSFLGGMKDPNGSLMAVFGGNMLAIVKTDVDGDEMGLYFQVSATLNDWIWDVQLSLDLTMLVGLAHNVVQVWQYDDGQITFLREIRGADRSITYSMQIHNHTVAVGTVMSEILVWSTEDHESTQDSLKGHSGVVHKLSFDDNGQRLASVGDDRTVRLWTKDPHWKLAWTAFGHEARCWSVAFCQHAVISTGEDSTTRLWLVDDGSPLGILRGHACQSIWSLDVLGSLVVTGANDGSLAAYDVGDYLLRHDGERSGWSRLHCVPEIAPLSKTSKSNAQGVVVGMQFCSMLSNQGVDESYLVVGLRSGSLWRLKVIDGTWEELRSWVPDASLTIDAREGCYLAVHPSGHAASIGTTGGDVVLVPLVTVNEEAGAAVVLPSKPHRTVQRLDWTNSSLIAYHVRSVLIWSFPDLAAGQRASIAGMSHQCCRVLHPGTPGMPICSAFSDSLSQLVVGDTRGNISLFDLGLDAKTLEPSSVLHRVHGKEHVTALAWVNSSTVMSVGNNGRLNEYAVHLDGVLELLLSLPLSSFSGIDRMWSFAAPNTQSCTLVAGYYGNIYALKDVMTGYEFFRVDTGGRQRLHTVELAREDSTGALVCRFAIAVNEKDRHTIQFVDRAIPGRKPAPFSSTWTHRCLTRRLHGETIFDSAFFEVGAGTMALLTASEDCSAMISVIADNKVVVSKALPSQESGVRAVCTSRTPGSSSTLIVAGGGKSMLQFFLVEDFHPGDNQHLRVLHLGQGKSTEKAEIDHRINSVRAVFVSNDSCGNSGVLVAAGDSNGRCHLFLIQESSRQSSYVGYVLYQHDYPIISLEFVVFGERILLAVGTTLGDVTVLGLDTTCLEDVSAAVLYHFQPHQMGTNVIAARVIPQDNGKAIVRICTGGDDQAISSIDVLFDPSMQETPRLVRSAILEPACSSAVRGLVMIDQSTLAAAGYDQQLRLFVIAYPQITQFAAAAIDIGDVNCLCLHARPDDRDRTLGIGGIGMQLLTFSPTFDDSSSSR